MSASRPSTDDLVLPRLFEAAVRRFPERVALVAGESSLTYAELDARANRVARLLRLMQVRDGSPVGLYLDRSLELCVMMLAVLKAGGAVVPLNPAYPAKMIRHIVEQTGLRTVLHEGQPSLSECALPLRLVEIGDLASESASQDETDLSTAPGAEDTAFLLFTSGSTGQPKGVEIAHRGLGRLAVQGKTLAVSEQDCFVQLAAFSFAASANELWMSLLAGAKLVMMPPGLPSLSDLRDLVDRHGVTVLSLPCGLFNLLVDNEIETVRRLRVLFVSGDFASSEHLAKAVEQTSVQIFNGYGCTENSAISSLFPMPSAAAVRELDRIPVGKPLPMVTMDVLDHQLNPCPPGDVGELCIGGAGVAKGYLDQPVLQSEKFLTLPRTGDRVYRTGDLARRTADDDIVLVGRSDTLVKIRGYRVETSAVELALKSCEDVEHAVVKAFANEAAEKSLVAFFTTWSGQSLEPAELMGHLGELVPDYMIPSDFRQLETMPLNLNGKIDRAALRAPVAQVPRPKESTVQNPLESVILQLWRDIIGSDEYSATDPFVGHGGNSLHFVKFSSTLQKVFAVDVRPEDIFRHGTVRKLAGYVDELRAGAGAEQADAGAAR